MVLINRELEPTRNADLKSPPARIGQGLLAATEKAFDPSGTRSKLEDSLERFSRQTIAQANSYIARIEKRQQEIGQLEAKVDCSAQKLQQTEADLHFLGVSGGLTPEDAVRAEAAYSSYLSRHQQHAARYDSPAGKPVSYRDFLLYGICRIDNEPTVWPHRPEQSCDNETPPAEFQGFLIQENPQIQTNQEPRTVYVPSHSRSWFKQLKQAGDLSFSGLFYGYGPSGQAWFSQHNWDEAFGVYDFNGQIKANDPEAQHLLLTAADHLDLRLTNQTKVEAFKAEIIRHNWDLNNLSSRIGLR